MLITKMQEKIIKKTVPFTSIKNRICIESEYKKIILKRTFFVLFKGLNTVYSTAKHTKVEYFNSDLLLQ